MRFLLLLVPRGSTNINGLVSVCRDAESWTYFLGTYLIYSHRKADPRMFRLIWSQLIDSGVCRQVDVIRTFGVSKSSFVRSLNKLRSRGPEAFFFEPESVGAPYIDGHVRVYHGRLTKLPHRYVSRERLCLRGVTDYWVNDAIGLRTRRIHLPQLCRRCHMIFPEVRCPEFVKLKSS